MKIISLALLFWVTAFAKTPSSAPKSYPKTFFSLPLVKGIKLDWVVTPIEENASDKADTAHAGFKVDAHGNPYFGYGARRTFLSPAKKIMFHTKVKFDDFAFVDDGVLVACNDKYLLIPQALKDKPKMEGDSPVVDMLALMKLDHGDCRLFSGGKGALYFVVHDESTGEDHISILNSSKSPARMQKIARAVQRVVALAGDGRTTFFAQGQVIYRVRPGETKPEPYFKAGDEVSGLAFSEKTGLFYTTPSHVGFAGPNLQMYFLTSPIPQIALRGNTLYIRLSRSLAVLKLSGVDKFKLLTKSEPKEH